MDVATIGRNKRPATVSIIGTAAVSTIKTVKTKLVIVFATKFATDVDAETCSLYLKEKLNRDVPHQKIVNICSKLSSFKITADCNDISEMYNPELWPKGAPVKKCIQQGR